MAKRKPPSGTALGALIAGFDHQVLRNVPPPRELVQKGQAQRGLSGEGGTLVSIELPDEAPPDPADPGEPPPA